MTSSLGPPYADAPHKSLEGVRPRMAKAVNKVERTWRERVGHAIARTFALAGVTQKEAAALLDRDPAQIARWVSSDERPQFDVMLSVETFRSPLVQALAELGGADVLTTITIRRTA